MTGITSFTPISTACRTAGDKEFRKLLKSYRSWTAGAWPCYVIDRESASVCGGAYVPTNMQWQPLAEAKEKDKWELHRR